MVSHMTHGYLAFFKVDPPPFLLKLLMPLCFCDSLYLCVCLSAGEADELDRCTELVWERGLPARHQEVSPRRTGI